MAYELTKVLPHVYRLHFQSAYQLAMHFLRAQEYYESPKFADLIFTLVEFMEWYSDKYGKGAFTYPADWSGFNVPSWVLDKVYGVGSIIPDFNKYDRLMQSLYRRLVLQESGNNLLNQVHPFYLIGTSEAGHKGDGDSEAVLDHELAHAMYYTDEAYKKDAKVLIRSIEFNALGRRGGTPAYRAALCLAKAGYHRRTIRDEIQAYASTGAHVFGMEVFLTPSVCQPFEDNFKKHKQRLLREGGREV